MLALVSIRTAAELGISVFLIALILFGLSLGWAAHDPSVSIEDELRCHRELEEAEAEDFPYEIRCLGSGRTGRVKH